MKNFKAGKTAGLERFSGAATKQHDGHPCGVCGGSESYHQSYVQDDNFAGYKLLHLVHVAGLSISGAGSQTCCSILEFHRHSGVRQRRDGQLSRIAGHLPAASFARPAGRSPAFTWQKTIDVASSANIAASQNGIDNPKNLSWSRGISSASIPFNWTTNFVYHSPELSQGRTRSCVRRWATGS